MQRFAFQLPTTLGLQRGIFHSFIMWKFRLLGFIGLISMKIFHFEDF